MKTLIHLFVLIISSLGLSHAAEPPTEFLVRFGVVQSGKPNEYFFDKETVVLPMKLRESGFLFGFEIAPPDDKPYTYRFLIHPPSPPREISGDLKLEDPAKTVTSGTEHVERGKYVYPFWFDVGDPLGDWKIEIFVNDKATRTINFKVVAERIAQP